MKMLKIVIFFSLLIFTVQSNAQYDSIYATVNGNIVTLWETGAQRNCGALYEMTVNLNDYYMKWVQLDTGMDAYCLCGYDLSVTYGPLEPGDYSVDVYYTLSFEPDEIYEGTTSFTIGGTRDSEKGGIISQYQSDCYSGIGIVDPVDADRNLFKIYPVPVKNGEPFNLEVSPFVGEANLEIFTLTGKLVYSKHYDGNQPIRDRLIKEELFPVPGIYIIRLKTSDNVVTRKVTVL